MVFTTEGFIYIHIYIYIYIYIYIFKFFHQNINQSETGINLGDKKILFNAMMDMFSPFKDVLKHNGMDYNSFYLFSLLNCVKYRLLKNILNHWNGIWENYILLNHATLYLLFLHQITISPKPLVKKLSGKLFSWISRCSYHTYWPIILYWYRYH